MVKSTELQQKEQVEQFQKTLKDIYFISGLGADKRVFKQLQLEGYQPVYIDWLEPEKGESLESYAKRLTAQIKSEHPILVGLSFGGIVAVEIAKQIEVEKVILISSTTNQSEIPPYFKFFRGFPIHRIFPFKSLLWAVYWILFWLFSLETIDERRLLRAILRDTDAGFIKWAIDKVVTWKNEIIPDKLYHIHGLNDRIFPVRFLKCDFWSEPGGHFIILSKAEQVSKWLEGLVHPKKAISKG
ncbi:alpha/beta fold hydrolase [Capilliphycus salinus ALCB114379]|uniref:alpha/beta hydrolase n=1 Tax=Capilliphycus salinus TaxID=2768948 RepID=UPI0039A5B965